MTISISGTTLTFNDATTQTTAAGFATGTVLLFYQAAAPTGWTQVTTQNNKALRVVSGTGGVSGGTTAFSTVFANQTPTITTSGLSAGATTLTTPQIPSHAHPWTYGTSGGPGTAGSVSVTNSQSTGSTGGGGSHNHPISGSATSSAITLDVQYIDIILASKN